MECRAQRGLETLGDPNGIARVGNVVEQHCEFVSSEPRQSESSAVSRNDIGSAKARLKPARHGNEQAVGAQQTQALVHHFESIEAENKERASRWPPEA